MAIVGLDPAKTMDIAKPPPPRDAGFSAGPKPNPEGASAPAIKAMLSVPGIYASGGPKDIHPLAAVRSRAHVAEESDGRDAHGRRRSADAAVRRAMPPHVTSSPDPRMNGRADLHDGDSDAEHHQLLWKLDGMVR